MNPRLYSADARPFGTTRCSRFADLARDAEIRAVRPVATPLAVRLRRAVPHLRLFDYMLPDAVAGDQRQPLES
jgi:hypothetical protein